MLSVFLLFNYRPNFYIFLTYILYFFFTYISYYIPAICNFIYPTHLVLGRGKCSPTLFFGRVKCLPTLFQEGANVRPAFFQGGANVLPLVLGRGKGPRGGGGRANVRLPYRLMHSTMLVSYTRFAEIRSFICYRSLVDINATLCSMIASIEIYDLL